MSGRVWATLVWVAVNAALSFCAGCHGAKPQWKARQGWTASHGRKARVTATCPYQMEADSSGGQG